MSPIRVSVEQIDAVLPQTQCTRCGYPDCHSYAAAITRSEAAINRCPPGGEAGIARLAELTGQPATPLDPSCGHETPRSLAVIDEQWCIGCTLCIKACPVDCIIGTHKLMHTVIEADCTGCELCLPVCPVDCIQLINASGTRTGWEAWSPAQATQARHQYLERQERQRRAAIDHEDRLTAKAEHKREHLEALTKANTPAELERKRAVIDAALARARARRATR